MADSVISIIASIVAIDEDGDLPPLSMQEDAPYTPMPRWLWAVVAGLAVLGGVLVAL